MEIKGKVHCFFEQSGTFKNEFIKLGIPAEDYDIQNNFGETDHIVDLFAEIDKAYDDKPSLFDSISQDDLIVAFYPCIYFCAASQMAFYLTQKNHCNLSDENKIKAILARSAKREEYYNRLIKFVGICLQGKIRMIFENPWAEQTYLKSNFLKMPDLIDNNRSLRGDFFIKPTAYWYWNCQPTRGESFQPNKNTLRVFWQKKNPQAGVCSEERSMISPDYARNFICDFIIGKKQPELSPQMEFKF
jgi:hypothetical protein